MASKTETDTEQTGTTSSSLLGAVEQRPKREGNFTGRTADPDKVNHLSKIFQEFVTFAKTNTIVKGQQIPVSDLGKWNPTQLATYGNRMLQHQRDLGNDPNFYLVATEQDDSGKPTKLVIRVGQPHRRKRRDKNAAE